MFSIKYTTSIVLIALCYLNLVGGDRWQASGAMNKTVMDFIWGNIGSNFPSYAGGASFIPYCTLLSDNLNGMWDPAWNVFTVRLMDQIFDAVLVGNGNLYSFVIWKDYNCKTWNTFSMSNFLVPKTTSDPFFPFAKHCRPQDLK
jgi:hypothetical protein